jgi:PhoD-like phosphatase
VADLVLGPLLRYVNETEATVWIETDAPCEVEVLGHRSRSFCVEGHHYAIVAVRGLEPGGTYEYEVALDGERRWPDPTLDVPPSTIRTIDPDGRLEIAFGSCRVAVPHVPPYTLTKDEDPEHGREIDALYALARRMRSTPRSKWPLVLLNIGDQVYVDEDAPQTRAFIRSRRDVSRPPGEEVLDFEEYTRLYWESWGEPEIRWLLSTISTAMIFDDHDVHDDWNTSQAWLEKMRAQDWWEERITSALMSYWVYQHIGNLAPDELERNELFERVRTADDAGPLLREFAAKADHSVNGSRWSYRRDLGRARVIVFDSREGRVLDGPKRKMVDDREWEWVEEQVSGDFDHLLLVDTLPILLAPGLHNIEAWNERVCAGAWGRALRAPGERIRRALDLEHWAAFNDSFERMERLIAEVGSGRHGHPPATIVALGGDVHHAYLAEVAFRRGAGIRSAVYQAVCSPFRNALDRHERLIVRFGSRWPGPLLTRALARSAGVAAPMLRWRLTQPPTFDNQFATLELEGRHARLRIEKILPGEWRDPRIDVSLERVLA